jgi:CheY-like chemotaxis protein
VFLEVEDSGCGIPGELLGKIYDPFFTTKPPGQGTGLGLAMAQAIVKDHDGQLVCQSQPGRGARFRILLPEARPREAQEPAGTCGEDPPAAATVLLADDDEAFRASWARIIRKAFQFQVLEARDGPEAVAQFQRHGERIDLVILDRAMPGLSGPEAFAAIRRIRPGARALLCSADPAGALGASAQAQGFLAFLHKPFALRDLEAVLSQAGLRPG